MLKFLSFLYLDMIAKRKKEKKKKKEKENAIVVPKNSRFGI